jgi:hypothetical protein
MSNSDVDNLILWVPLADDETQWTAPLQKVKLLEGTTADLFETSEATMV